MNNWKFIQEKLSASVDVILLYVLESKGSSPGRQGFNMAVAADATFSGSIGGGIMEHKFVEMAKAILAGSKNASTVFKQFHDKESGKDQSGMICSGEQSIFLYQVKREELPQINQLIESLAHSRNGTLHLSHDGISFSEDIPAIHYYFNQKNEQQFLFLEKTGFKNHLHIIGGGHCALALSKLMRELDFYISVYDERPGLNTMDENTHAHEKIIVDSYNDLNSLIEGGGDRYVVIMTFGYRTDDIALRALIGKHFKYIGMLGSKKKVEKLFISYKVDNIDEQLLNSIHSPIGVQVKSQTPAEIAISIAAEIIAVKNKDQ